MTNSDVAAAQGKDLEEIYDTLKWEKELAESYGLDFTGNTEVKEDGKEKDKEDKPKNDNEKTSNGKTGT
mgnify:CR=1 FL=1